jgi:SET domain-containing protein|tara:strand:- start:18657 stop:18953 length:297 start_codon:yes stop_codon:yes gene_type:complete
MSYKPLSIFCTIKPSFIEGLGIFSTREIKKNTDLGISHIELDNEFIRTPLGGFLNHQEKPNCKRIKKGNKWFLITTEDIMPNQELTLKYSLYIPNEKM